MREPTPSGPSEIWRNSSRAGRAEQHDESAVARRYMSAESIAKALAPPSDEHEEVMAIEAAA